MAVYFCDVMDNLKSAFKNAAGSISGNRRLEKRGLPKMDDQGLLVAIGAMGGLFAGMIAGMIVDGGGYVTKTGVETLFTVWGVSAIGMPIVRGQLTSAYRASAHDKKIALLEAPKKMNALPAPSSPSNNVPLI